MCAIPAIFHCISYLLCCFNIIISALYICHYIGSLIAISLVSFLEDSLCILLFTVTLLYISIVYIFNSSFLVRVLAMPHPLCTYTLRVLYACGREFLPSVYFLPITWNGIPPLVDL